MHTHTAIPPDEQHLRALIQRHGHCPPCCEHMLPSHTAAAERTPMNMQVALHVPRTVKHTPAHNAVCCCEDERHSCCAALSCAPASTHAALPQVRASTYAHSISYLTSAGPVQIWTAGERGHHSAARYCCSCSSCSPDLLQLLLAPSAA